MPDSRSLRGPHPKDDDCFKVEELPRLRTAVSDLCWFLSRGYPSSASLKLVGDRYQLRDRQRKAVQRSAASDAECEERRRRLIAPTEAAGKVVQIDGYNVLLTVEAALSRGVLLHARDGTLRDLAAMSGHYRRVHTTRPALHLLATFLTRLGCERVQWFLDRPVSNSGRLKRLMEGTAQERGLAWDVDLVANPDTILAESHHIVATADSAILDRCRRWINLAHLVVRESVPEAWIVDLRVTEIG